MRFLGTWWNNKSIEIYMIEGKRIALNGWNGENYEDCFEVSEDLYEILAEGIRVTPIYKAVAEDEFKIVGYEIL